jgi:hypothetical protein
MIPNPAQPNEPPGCSPNALPQNACRAFLRIESSFNNATWWRQTPFDLGEGLTIVALLVLIRPRMRIPDWPSTEGRLPVALGILFSGLFLLLAFGAHVNYWVEVDLQARWLLPSVTWLRGLTDGPVYLGSAAFISLFLASFFLALHFGLRNTLLRFSAPLVLGFMVSLAIFDVREMPIHVTNFTVGLSFDGFDFVSNWSILLVSGCLTLLNPPQRDLFREYQVPLPAADGWWRGENQMNMIQECPKCHKPSWLPYQKKVTKEGDQFYSHVVYPHLDESRRRARKCVVKIPAPQGVLSHS